MMKKSINFFLILGLPLMFVFQSCEKSKDLENDKLLSFVNPNSNEKILVFDSFEDFENENERRRTMDDLHRISIEKEIGFTSAKTYEDIISEKINNVQSISDYEKLKNEENLFFNFEEENFGLRKINKIYETTLNKEGLVIIGKTLNYFNKENQIVIMEYDESDFSQIFSVDQTDVKSKIYKFDNTLIEERASCTADQSITKSSSDRKLRCRIYTGLSATPIYSGGLFTGTWSVIRSGAIDILPTKKGAFGIWNKYTTDLRHDISYEAFFTINSGTTTMPIVSSSGLHSSNGEVYVNALPAYVTTAWTSGTSGFLFINGWSNSTPFNSRNLGNPNDPNNGAYFDCD